MFLVSVADANTLSWSGAGGTDATWGNSANWGFVGTPGNGDTVIFRAGSANLVNTNNIAGLTLNQIIFVGAGGGYDIRGNAFTLTNGILETNTAGGNTIENNITLTGNIEVAVSNSVSLAMLGVLSGTGGVNKTGMGPLTYQCVGNNTYTGTTLVGAGTLQLNVSGPTAFSGPLVIGDGTGTGSPTVLDLQSFEMENTGSFTINSNGNLSLNGFSETALVTTNIMLNDGEIQTLGGTLGLSPNTTFTINGNNVSYIDGNLNLGGGTLTIQGFGYTVAIYANVSGAANIVQNEFVEALWAGVNTYVGNYTANDLGVVVIGSSYALGNTNNTMTLNGQSSVAFTGLATVTNQSLTINSSPLYGDTILDIVVATDSWQASNFTFNVSSPVYIESGCALNLIGPIGGPGGLTKVGGGDLTLSGTTSNTYAGTTTVVDGTLLLGKTSGTAIPGSLVIDSNATVRLLSSFQIYNPSATVMMYDTSLLDLAGFDEWVGPTTMQGAQITAGTGIFYFSGNITVSASTVAQSLISGNAAIWDATCTITNIGHNFSPDLLISANLFSGGSGSGGLIKDGGGGEVSLSGNNSFLGPVTINNGDLWAQSSTALGNTNTPVTVNNGGSLFLDGVGLDFGLKPLVLSGSGWAYGSLFYNGSSYWEGNVTLNTDSQIYAFSSSSLTVTGAISGAGGIILAGPGTLTYAGSNANSYAGLTTVNDGTLLLNKKAVTIAVPGNLVVSGNSSVAQLGNSVQLADADVLVTNGGLFNCNSNYDYINTLRGNGTVNFGVRGYLIVGNNNGSSEFDGPMTGAGFAGGYTVGKFGNGTLTLGGNNTFSSGAYQVVSGRVLVNGSSPQIPAIVDSGGILGGTGSVGIITGYGTVSPGASIGILTSSNLNFSSSGDFNVVISGPNAGIGGYSQLIVTGVVSLANANLTVEPAFATPPTIGQQFTIIKNNGGSAVSGTFNGLVNGAQFNSGGYFFRINYNGGAGNDVVLTLIGSPQQTVTLNAVNMGWYDSTGSHSSANPNYYVGEDTLTNDTKLYRNFFVFNAPVSSYSIISAELIVNDYICSSPNGRETYVLYDVTNDISAVEAGGSGFTNIYDDLGSGDVYGIRTISTNETGERAIIPLNYGFINDLTAAAGGQIALGGAMTTLAPTNGHDQYLFSYSEGNPTDVQLRVTFGTSIITNAIAQGWYNTAGTHPAGNPNYIAGIYIPETNDYRDFFVFNVPPFSGQPVSAELWVNSFSNASPFGVNTYQLHGVSTPISTLTNNVSIGATAIYADLGDGTYYGGRDVYDTESYHMIGIPLNNAFISAATDSGGSIALGGVVSSLTMASSNEYIFGDSGVLSTTNVSLWLGFLASPQSAPSFTGGTPTYLGNNEYQLKLSGATSTTNEIQSTFDFQNWDYISDVVVPGVTTTFYYTNGNPAVPYRFFRARVQP